MLQKGSQNTERLICDNLLVTSVVFQRNFFFWNQFGPMGFLLKIEWSYQLYKLQMILISSLSAIPW